MSKIPSGFCQCGCGKRTSLADYTGDGYVIGQPHRYIKHHQPTANAKELEARFWKLIDVRTKDECWEWKSFKKSKRRGRFSIAKGVRISAPRAAYIFAYGSIPDELEACHTCDTPSCCNPNHLFAGTHQENMQDASRKNRLSRTNSPLGEKHGNAVMTKKLVLRIRSLARKGFTPSQILRVIKRSNRSTIGDIIRRKSWRHLP